MKRVLVTTALQKTWPSSNEPILFLGEWCLLYSEKEKWEKLNFKTAPYHWDDRKKIFKDYNFINKLYEELLSDLAKKLNSTHKVNHSIRYWRIIIGPWLGFFIQTVFDRWSMIEKIIETNNISYVNVIKCQDKDFIPNDLEHFSEIYVDDPWNEYIYGKILEFYNFKKIKYITDPKIKLYSILKIRSFYIKKFKKNFNLLINSINRLVSRDDDYFLISTYLPIKQSFLLQIKLGQIPKFWKSIHINSFNSNFDFRNWSLCNKKLNNNPFADFIRKIIPMNIPVAYLEGFGEIQNLSNRLPWPRKPKAIFTSNAFWHDDVFNFWCANLIESGVPLVTGQHGGNYGMALWSFVEDHQIEISDRFLTWGWRSDKNENIKPLVNLKNLGQKIKSNSKGHLLLVEMMLPRYSYHMSSLPVSSSQFEKYLTDQYTFLKNLPPNIQKKILVRTTPFDFGYDVNQRWIDSFPFVKLDPAKKSFVSSMKKSRLFIGTYNATTFLEALSLNFPTIVFWNPEHWELNIEATKSFKILKDVGIFHDTPEDAAKKLIAIWDDIETWWHSEEIQSARNKFCNSYSCMPDKSLEELKYAILDL